MSFPRLVITVIFFFMLTSYFGWHYHPISPAEVICNGIWLLMFCLSFHSQHYILVKPEAVKPVDFSQGVRGKYHGRINDQPVEAVKYYSVEDKTIEGTHPGGPTLN